MVAGSVPSRINNQAGESVLNRTQAKWLIENWDRVEGMRLSHVDERNKPMIEAFAAGKVVECSRLRADSTSWEASEDMKFIGSPDMYRIRPEEKYVPFEVADLMKLVDADVRVTDGKHVAIVGALRYVSHWMIELQSPRFVCAVAITPEEFLKTWTFVQDGEPCGRLVN